MDDLSEKAANDMRDLFKWVQKDPDEIDDICDSGAFNKIIEGYCRIVFDDLELADHLKDYNFYDLFDDVSAHQARKRAERQQ